MPRVKGIFVPAAGVTLAKTDATATRAEASQFTQAAVGFEEFIIETEDGKAVRKNYMSPYDPAMALVVVDVPVAEVQYAAGLAAAAKLMEPPEFDVVSETACTSAGVQQNVLGKSGEGAVSYCQIFRAMFPGFLAQVPAGRVTLQLIYEATVDLANETT